MGRAYCMPICVRSAWMYGGSVVLRESERQRDILTPTLALIKRLGGHEADQARLNES